MSYPSDISEAQFALIADLLESHSKKTRPRRWSLHALFNALLYVLKTGCQWRALPHEYPDYRSVHRLFMRWSRIPEGQTESLLDQVLIKLRLWTFQEKVISIAP